MSLLPYALVSLTLLGPPPDARELVRQGNDLLDAGQAAEAMAMYKDAEVDRPESPQVFHNQAVANYALRQYDEARDLFIKARAAKDRGVDLSARHGLAACDHAEAIEKIDSLPDAIALLESAMGYYKAVLDEDAEHSAARGEMRRAALLWRSLKDKLKKQQEEEKKKQEEQKKNPQSQPSSRPQSQPSKSPESQPGDKPDAPKPTPSPQKQDEQKQSSQAKDRKKLSQEDAKRQLRSMMDRQDRRKRGRPKQRDTVRVLPGSTKDW